MHPLKGHRWGTGQKICLALYAPPKQGQNQNWLPNSCLFGAHKWAEMLHNPYILGGPQTKRDEIRIGCLTPPFSGAHKWSEMLHSGSVRWTKQTLPPQQGGGGGFGCVKTLLLPKFLADEKRGGYVKPTMLSFSADAPPPLVGCTMCPGVLSRVSHLKGWINITCQRPIAISMLAIPVLRGHWCHCFYALCMHHVGTMPRGKKKKSMIPFCHDGNQVTLMDACIQPASLPCHLASPVRVTVKFQKLRETAHLVALTRAYFVRAVRKHKR